MTQVSTFFALMAEYGTAEIPLEKVCEKLPDKSFIILDNASYHTKFVSTVFQI